MEVEQQRSLDCPISRLPNEILVDIFEEVRRSCFNDDLSWHKVAHVSQHWRRVALEAASLWTNPPTYNHAYTLLMLECSRMSPLNIYLEDPTSTATFTAVLDNIARIESLSIAQDSAELHDCQTHLLKLRQDASQLKSLDIWYSPLASRQSSTAFKLSAKTFQRPLSLQGMSLKALDYDWNIFPIPSLTTLSLGYSAISDPPSWMEFQDALHGMPLLEKIKLSLDDLGLYSPGPSSPQPLHLPRLRNLAIMGGAAPAISHFISQAEFPRLNDLRIVCSSSGRDPDDYITTVQVVLLLLSHGVFGRPGCLQIGPEGLSLSRVSSTDLEDSRHFKFICGRLATPEAMFRLIQAMMKNPFDPLSHISRLVMMGSPLVAENLVDLFGSLAQLESIQADYDAQTVIECLRTPPSHTPNTPAPFASVQEIILGKSRDRAHYVSSMVGKLYSCLKLRCELGFPLKKLTLNWKLTSEQASSLQDIVDDVLYVGG